jgi:single-strand DNA-binding protein
MNSVALIGRLTKEADLRYSSSGTAVYRNSLAVNRKFNKDETDFINILAFKKTGELMANHLSKGDPVGIEGHIQTGSYEKDGKKIYTFEVVVDNITFIGGGKKEEKPAQRYTADPGDPFQNNGQININDSDLPF